MIFQNMSFKYSWRIYQNRILQSFIKHQVDNRVHIVAAPGSGKTTLGIELIRRVGKVSLILAPNVSIREQWVKRIKEGFLPPDFEYEKHITTDISNPKEITIVTYQALNSLMHDKTIVEGSEENEESSAEEIDKIISEKTIEKDEILKKLIDLNVGCICLDEAHHLTNEWWESLEKFVSHFKGIFKISLTATPPYDSNKEEWNRYITMCGPIDEEIFSLELVKEGSLCAHQDYLY